METKAALDPADRTQEGGDGARDEGRLQKPLPRVPRQRGPVRLSRSQIDQIAPLGRPGSSTSPTWATDAARPVPAGKSVREGNRLGWLSVGMRYKGQGDRRAPRLHPARSSASPRSRSTCSKAVAAQAAPGGDRPKRPPRLREHGRPPRSRSRFRMAGRRCKQRMVPAGPPPAFRDLRPRERFTSRATELGGRLLRLPSRSRATTSALAVADVQRQRACPRA